MINQYPRDRWVLDELDAFWFGTMKMMHLNDSKQGLGSNIDRHAKIGEGALGMEGVQAVVNHPVLSELPFILESPVDDYQEYGEEIRKVRKLRKGAV